MYLRKKGGMRGGRGMRLAQVFHMQIVNVKDARDKYTKKSGIERDLLPINAKKHALYKGEK